MNVFIASATIFFIILTYLFQKKSLKTPVTVILICNILIYKRL